MNFYDKKFKKTVSIVILVIILAMVATMIIPYLCKGYGCQIRPRGIRCSRKKEKEEAEEFEDSREIFICWV